MREGKKCRKKWKLYERAITRKIITKFDGTLCKAFSGFVAQYFWLNIALARSQPTNQKTKQNNLNKINQTRKKRDGIESNWHK